VTCEETELASRERERVEDHIGVAAQVLLTTHLPTQRREDVAQPQAHVIGADDDEPAAGPVGHLRQRLRAPRSRAVDEHDDRVRAVLIVDRKIRVAVTHLDWSLLVGDLRLLRLGQCVANVVGLRVESGLAVPLCRVPDLGGHTVDGDRARADGPRSALAWIGRDLVKARVVAAGDLCGRPITGIAIAIAVAIAGITIAVAVAITRIAITIAGCVAIAVTRSTGAGVTTVAHRVVVRTRNRGSEQRHRGQQVETR
jgi:hypothetical protein